LTAEEAIELAANAKRRPLGWTRACRNSEGGSVASHAGVMVYGNSHAFAAAIRPPALAELLGDRPG